MKKREPKIICTWNKIFFALKKVVLLIHHGSIGPRGTTPLRKEVLLYGAKRLRQQVSTPGCPPRPTRSSCCETKALHRMVQGYFNLYYFCSSLVSVFSASSGLEPSEISSVKTSFISSEFESFLSSISSSFKSSVE